MAKACCEHHGINMETGCSKSQQTRLQSLAGEITSAAVQIFASTSALLKSGELLQLKAGSEASSSIFKGVTDLLQAVYDLQTPVEVASTTVKENSEKESTQDGIEDNDGPHSSEEDHSSCSSPEYVCFVFRCRASSTIN
eukprot:scpid104378/ scgid7990/ 